MSRTKLLPLAKSRPARVFAANSLAIGCTLAMEAFMANTLGPSGYGIFAYAAAWAMFLGTTANAGFENCVLRLGTIYVHQSDWASLRGLESYALRFALATGVVVASAGLFAFISLTDNTETRRVCLIALIAVPLLSLVRVLSGLARAYGGLIVALAPDRIMRDGCALVMAAVAYLLLPEPFLPDVAIVCWLVACAISFAMMVAATRTLRPHEIMHVVPSHAPKRRWLQTALPLGLIYLIQNQSLRVDIILVGTLADIESAGIYNIATLIAKSVVFPLSVLNFVYAPTIAALYENKNKAMIQRVLSKSSLYSMVLALAVVAIPFVHPSFFTSMFGVEDERIGFYLRILLASQFFSACMGMITPVLTMTGHELTVLKVLLGIFVVKTILALVVIPQFELLGAVCLAAGATIAFNVILGKAIWLKLGIFPGAADLGRRARK